MKKHIRNILVALMTLSLIMLAGCGGGSSEQTDAAEASETSQSEASQAASPIGIHHAECNRQQNHVCYRVDVDCPRQRPLRNHFLNCS